MSNEWLELGYQIPYQTFLELRSGRVFEIMNLHPLSMFFHHLGWFSSFLVCLWLHLNLTCPPIVLVERSSNRIFAFNRANPIAVAGSKIEGQYLNADALHQLFNKVKSHTPSNILVLQKAEEQGQTCYCNKIRRSMHKL